MCCCCCRVVFHGLVGRGDKVLRAVQLFVVVVVFVLPLVFGREREGGVRRLRLKRKLRTPASEGCIRAMSFLSLVVSTLSLISLFSHSHPSMYASIWLCGASCDSGGSKPGSS